MSGSHHHRLVHEGGFGVRRERDGELVFLREPAHAAIPLAA